jgi:glyoxylase-like metal-dependent hydrolase (beta-lactamase superfamily II)
MKKILFAIALTACSSKSATPTAADKPTAAPIGVKTEPKAEDNKALIIHQFVASDKAFVANAYIIETTKAVIAIDAPFIVSEAKRFRAQVDAIGKPLQAVLITHAHPDHVNGITQLLEGRTDKVSIIATAGVTKTLKEIDGPKRQYWSPIYKEEYPAVTTFPNTEIQDGTSVTFDGVTFTAFDIGAGESADETIWITGKNAFVGDVVMNRTHPWLAEGRSAGWLASLKLAESKMGGVTTVYPGHGIAGDLSVLAWQASYLEAYRAAIRELGKGKPTLDVAGKAALEAKMKAFLPSAPLEALIAMSADSVAAELAAATK